MKIHQFIIPFAACALTLGSCDDQEMKWIPSDDSVTMSDIPLELAEKIALYDYIKVYAAQYTPQMTVGLGVGADKYLNDEAYKQIADNNFQLFTTGNAMKHQSVVSNSGSLNFATIDAFLAAVPQDIAIYGHNFLLHTKQNQNYLRSLISPETAISPSAQRRSGPSRATRAYLGGRLENIACPAL